jgi:hypothetical protein
MLSTVNINATRVAHESLLYVQATNNLKNKNKTYHTVGVSLTLFKTIVYLYRGSRFHW